jgi:phage terminase large subunit
LAMGFTANVKKGDVHATEFGGLHGPYMLAIMDESTAIFEEVKNAIDGMLVGPDDRTLALGNPTIIGSWFHKASQSRAWNRIIIDALNHPNVTCDDARIIPGAVSRVWVEKRRQDWGEDSALWQAKVRGQFPSQGSDTLIRIEWLEAAQARWIEASRREVELDDKKGIAAGLDIAGEGTDLTVFSIIQNGAWEIPEVNGRRAFHFGKDIDKAIELVMDALAEGIHIRILSLDDTGLGQGVTAGLRKYQREGKIPRDMWINPVNFGKSAWNDAKFELTKDQMWWDAAEVFRERDFSIPPDSEIETWGLPVGNSLQGQLMAPIYENIRQGKIAVYDKAGHRGRKEKTKGLPTKSPDIAHSFILSVHSWLKLRSDAKEPPPETTQDIFQRNFIKMKEKSRIRRKGDRTNHAAPWVKMHRS